MTLALLCHRWHYFVDCAINGRYILIPQEAKIDNLARWEKSMLRRDVFTLAGGALAASTLGSDLAFGASGSEGAAPDLSLVDAEMLDHLRGKDLREPATYTLANLRKPIVRQAPSADGALKWQNIPGMPGQPPVPCYICDYGAPATGLRPAVVWIHGGGFIAGTAGVDPLLQEKAKQLGWLIISPEYRLAPETRWKDSVEDNYAALRWLHDNARALKIDPARIAIAGGSAGGGHAALLTLAARDRREIAVAYQLLIYPMLDDRTGSTRTPHEGSGQFLWTARTNKFGWEAFLGVSPGSDAVPAKAVPARYTDLRGLPPTFIGVGTIDLFLDESLAYATRLVAQHVPVDLAIVPGAYHGFRNSAPQARGSRDFNARWIGTLAQALS